MEKTAVEKVKEKAMQVKPSMSISVLIEKSMAELGKALPAHMNPERLVRIAHTTLRNNPALYRCNPHSFLAALFQSAQLGLEPNTLGESWIIPYNIKGQPMAQFQIGYQGFVKLYWNHPAAERLFAEKVHLDDINPENLKFMYNFGTGEVSHTPDVFKEDRGPVVGYYAGAHLRGGGRSVKVMRRTEVEAFAKRYSKCYDYKEGRFIAGTPWAEHFDEMAKKTVLKQLLKLLPKSIEIQKAFAMDETVKSRIAEDMIEIPNEDDYLEVGNGNETDPPSEQVKAEAPVQGTDKGFTEHNVDIKSPFNG